MSFSRTDEDKNAAVTASGALLNSGYIKVYDGTPPADVNTALSGNNILATGDFSATAFGTASGGTASANAISAGTGTTAAGVGTTATFARTFKTDNTTATRQSKVFPARAAKTTVAATATGFTDSGSDLFTEIVVGDSFSVSGFTSSSIDGKYLVTAKASNGSISTYPAPPTTETAGQSITYTPDGIVLDNVSIADGQTVTFSSFTITSLDLDDLG